MRALSLHRDVVVVVSRVWQTTCTIVRAGEEAFVIDSPVYPDELEVLPTLLTQAGFAFSGLLTTHADWDHLLGPLAFASATLGAAETTGARLRAEPGVAQRELARFDEDHYVSRPHPLALSALQPLPVPGRCALGDQELDLHSSEGHTADGMAVWVGWANVLVCGDYLSDVEIPVLGAGGSLGAYRATLERLAPLVDAAEHVVCGHGGPLRGDQARAVLEADVNYLDALGAVGAAAALPPGRTGARQREIHAANADLAAVSGGP